MKIASVIVVLCMLFGGMSASFAASDHRCDMCGMDAAKSQTEFIVHWSDGKEGRTCCLHCLYLLQKTIKDTTMAKIETRDFAGGTLIYARQAYYLDGSSVIPKGSMAPFLPAFSEKKAADIYEKKYNGTVLTFKQAMESVARFDEEVNAR